MPLIDAQGLHSDESAPVLPEAPAPTCEVIGVAWERVQLTLTVRAEIDQSIDSEISFALRAGKKALVIPHTVRGEGVYALHMNVTTFGGRRQIPDGTWRIALLLDGGVRADAGFDLREAQILDPASRVFLYDKNRMCYTVSFTVSEDERYPLFLMRTYLTSRKLGKKKPKLASRLKSQRNRRVAKWRRDTLARTYRLAHRFRPPNGRRILFASEMRPALGGNLKAIHDRLHARGLSDHFELSYSFRTPESFGARGALRLAALLGSADWVLVDDYFPILNSIALDRGTKLVQVWHAGSGFKSIGLSRFGRFGSPKLGANLHRKYTYAITGSTHLVQAYAEAFGIEPAAVIPTGLPRIDEFLDPERVSGVVSAIEASYPVLQGRKRILFAPTFRGRGVGDASYDYDRIDFEALYDFCGDDTVVMFRMHHFISDPVPIPEAFGDRLVDVTAFPETNDLLHATDILITDYSSIIYEFSLLGRPMLFFAYDKVPYSVTRGFHRDYDEMAPGKVCETFTDLLDALRREDFEMERLDAFREENFDAIDRHSSDRFIDWLLLGNMPPQLAGGAEATAVGEVATTEGGMSS